jgi:hypothetical protein
VTALIYSAIWIAGITFAPFAFVESIISSDVKKRLSEFLKSNSAALDNLPPIAAKLFARVFGDSHFSFRCLFASVLSSLFFLSLAYILRLLVIVAIHQNGGVSDVGHYLLEELKYPFVDGIGMSFFFSLLGNLILDFIGLLKTRLIIGFLVRGKHSMLRSVLAAILDLVFSFLIFQIFYVAFCFVGLVVTFGGQHILLPAADPYSFMPMVELMILFNFATNHVYPSGTALNFLMHSHALGILLAVNFLPVYLTSVFFYASIAPSIWLWLFVQAGIVSRWIAPIWPFTLYALNFEQAPLKMIGLVSGALVAGVWVLAFVVAALGLATLSVFL